MTFCVSFAGYDLDKGKDDLVYIAVNTYWEDVRITLPKVYGRVAWYMNVNTGEMEKENIPGQRKRHHLSSMILS